MEPDPLLISNTRQWLRLADEDLATAELAFTTAQPLLRSALFHCQQSVEKALKALLTWHDVPFRRTHSLEELGEACARIDPGVTALLDRATAFSMYAVRVRYPGAPWEPTREEASKSVALAREIVEFVLSRLPGEVRS